MSLAFLAKKSWAVQTKKNQETVWLAQQEKAREDARAEELRKQIAEERQMKELRDLQVQAGLVPKDQAQERMDWMYEGPAAAAQAQQSAEEYLLGQKKFDGKARGAEDLQKLESAPGASFMAEAAQDDSFARLHEDPLLMIRRQQLAARQAALERHKLAAGARAPAPVRSRSQEKAERKAKKKAKKAAKKRRRRSPSSSRSRSRSRSHGRGSGPVRDEDGESRKRHRADDRDRDDRRDRDRRDRDRRGRDDGERRDRDRDDRRDWDRRDRDRDDRRDRDRRDRDRDDRDRRDRDRDDRDRRARDQPEQEQERDDDQGDALQGGSRYGLQRNSTFALDSKRRKAAPTAIGPDAEMLARREQFLKAKAKPAAPERRRLTDEERKAAAEEMMRDAKRVDSARAALAARKADEDAEEEPQRGSARFLNKMGTDLYAGGDESQSSVEERLKRNRFYAQRPDDSL